MQVWPHSASESCECPRSSRRALGDRPSPLTSGLSASAARSALRQPMRFCMALPVVATVMVKTISATLGFTDLVLGALKSPSHLRAMNRTFGALFVVAGSLLAMFKRAG